MRIALANERGFTLIEAMVAIVVMAIGILGVMWMQSSAVNANSSAFYRTSATGVSISIMEALKNLPFDDPNLTATGAGNGVLVNDANAHTLTAAILAAIPMLNNSYQLVGTNLVARGAGASAGRHAYRVSWAVVNNVTDGDVSSKTIRLYLSWTSVMGPGTADNLTAVKYNNIKL